MHESGGGGGGDRRSRGARGVAIRSFVLCSSLPLLVALGALAPPDEDPEAGWELAAATILEEDVSALLAELTSPYLEGRDSPSYGADHVARRMSEHFAALGLVPPGKLADHFHRYERTDLLLPDDAACRLAATGTDGPQRFELGVDFTPLRDAAGTASGPLVWCGYGIDVRGFDELRGLDLKGAVAIFAEGEPRHDRVLDGPELTPAANVYRKLEALEAAGAVGALVVRREPPADVPRPEGWPETQPMGFRAQWAFWNGERPDAVLEADIPALEISADAARRLIGERFDTDLEAIDSSGKPSEGFELGLEVQLTSATRSGSTGLVNVLGLVTGRDPELAREVVVVGAHFDHIGVDRRGRVGSGADDNASGTAALFELAEAFAASPARRSILFCGFSSEEDGLIGSQALVRDLGRGEPLALGNLVAMINLDMIGRGDPKRLDVIGADRSTDLDRLVNKARRLTRTGLSKVVTGEGSELWMRSDHYPFADAGVPAVFLFEENPISKNRDYHTWRDTYSNVDPEKIARVARFAGNLLWLVAEDDDRPSFGG